MSDPQTQAEILRAKIAALPSRAECPPVFEVHAGLDRLQMSIVESADHAATMGRYVVGVDLGFTDGGDVITGRVDSDGRMHFDPARDLNHAVICPLCASLLSHYESRVWTCENNACPFEATNDQMTAMLGRETRPTIPT